MDALNKQFSEDEKDILLARYITGEADRDEVNTIEQWMELSGENKQEVEQLKFIWEKTGNMQVQFRSDSRLALQKFHEQINNHPDDASRRRTLRRRWLAAAAILLPVTIILSIVLWNKQRISAVKIISVVSGSKMLTDTLPDGSIAVLQPDSRLTYSSDFATNHRSVSLTGDAFFNVQHDSLRPFSIEVKEITVTVRGTSFNIESSGNNIQIAVITGVVEISGMQKKETLHAHDHLSISQTGLPWIKQTDTAASTMVNQEIKVKPGPHLPKILQQIPPKPVPALIVGDKAPVLPLDKWIKGETLNIYDKRKVYLVDFWAVWCGPCIAGMERLSEWQQKYRSMGLEVISATSEDAWGNSYDSVVNFIKNKGEKFNYHFAWLPLSWRNDHKYKSIIYNPWLQLAYDSSSFALPQVFVLDIQGRIAFIGDGYNLSEDFLVSVLNRTYDTARERKNYLEKISLENQVSYFSGLLDKKETTDALILGRSIVNNPLVTSHTLLAISDNLFNKYKDLNSTALISLGFEAAKKGAEVTAFHSPGHLSILAKGYSLIHKPADAVKTIKMAIELAEGGFKDALIRDLKIYEQEIH